MMIEEVRMPITWSVLDKDTLVLYQARLKKLNELLNGGYGIAAYFAYTNDDSNFKTGYFLLHKKDLASD